MQPTWRVLNSVQVVLDCTLCTRCVVTRILAMTIIREWRLFLCAYLEVQPLFKSGDRSKVVSDRGNTEVQRSSRSCIIITIILQIHIPFPKYSCNNEVHSVTTCGDSDEKDSVTLVVITAKANFSLSNDKLDTKPPNSSIGISLISLTGIAGWSLYTISWRRPEWVILNTTYRGFH